MCVGSNGLCFVRRRYLTFYPSGNGTAATPSLYLAVASVQSLWQGWSRLVHFTLTLHNQKDHKKSVSRGMQCSLLAHAASPLRVAHRIILEPVRHYSRSRIQITPNIDCKVRSPCAATDGVLSSEAEDRGFRDVGAAAGVLQDTSVGYIVDDRVMISVKVRVILGGGDGGGSGDSGGGGAAAA